MRWNDQRNALKSIEKQNNLFAIIAFIDVFCARKRQWTTSRHSYQLHPLSRHLAALTMNNSAICFTLLLLTIFLRFLSSSFLFYCILNYYISLRTFPEKGECINKNIFIPKTAFWQYPDLKTIKSPCKHTSSQPLQYVSNLLNQFQNISAVIFPLYWLW